MDLPIQQWLEEDNQLHEDTLRERIIQSAVEEYQRKEDLVGAETLRSFEKNVMLQVLDELWKEHLSAMDHLRRGIHLRGYAQKDPKQEYKKESFQMFTNMLDTLKLSVITALSRVQVRFREEVEEAEKARREAAARQMANMQYNTDENANEQTPQPNQKIGRNEPCPCGSGKKYKHCHGSRAKV